MGVPAKIPQVQWQNWGRVGGKGGGLGGKGGGLGGKGGGAAKYITWFVHYVYENKYSVQHITIDGSVESGDCLCLLASQSEYGCSAIYTSSLFTWS